MSPERQLVESRKNSNFKISSNLVKIESKDNKMNKKLKEKFQKYHFILY